MTTTLPASARPPAILVVEDERIVAMDLRQTLVRMGYDVTGVASSADEALAQARERRPDIALMDIRLRGDLDGVGAAAVLREELDVPVIYLTAHADDATIQRAKATAPLGYLLKPVRTAELKGVLEISLHRHGLEMRIRAQERWLATTLRSIAEGVIAIDAESNVRLMNPAAERLSGVSAAEALGKPVQVALPLLDRDGARLTDPPVVTALRERRTVQLGDLRLRHRRTDEIRRIDDSSTPVVDGDELLGAVMAFRDVTSEHETRTRLATSERLAALGRLAAGVAHELNNPLAVIVGSASFIGEEFGRRTAPELTVREALDDVLTAATRMARIIADLGSLVRPARAEPPRADLSTVVAGAIRATTASVRDRARLTSRIETLPPVVADATRIEQVIVNLVRNAVQAIPPGHRDAHEILVTARLHDERRVVLEVVDDGPGILPEHLPRVFDPFFTTKAPGDGTGLGLSLCRAFVESEGGTIDVESVPGRTTFRVLLEVAPPAQSQPRPPSPAPVARRRVLVVDDEPLVRKVSVRMLEPFHDVVAVATAGEALERLASGDEYDVILSDLKMTDMSGTALLAELAVHHPAHAARVLFVTGADIDAPDRTLGEFKPPVLTKPATRRDLLAAIESVVEREARGVVPRATPKTTDRDS